MKWWNETIIIGKASTPATILYMQIASYFQNRVVNLDVSKKYDVIVVGGEQEASQQPYPLPA